MSKPRIVIHNHYLTVDASERPTQYRVYYKIKRREIPGHPSIGGDTLKQMVVRASSPDEAKRKVQGNFPHSPIEIKSIEEN